MQIDFRYATHFQTGYDLRSAFGQASAGMLVLVVDGRAMRPASGLTGIFPFADSAVRLVMRPMTAEDEGRPLAEYSLRDVNPFVLRDVVDSLPSPCKCVSLVNGDGEKCLVQRGLEGEHFMSLEVINAGGIQRVLRVVSLGEGASGEVPVQRRWDFSDESTIPLSLRLE